MVTLDRRGAWLLICALALAALASFAQGLTHELSARRPESPAAGVDPSRDPVPNASPIAGPVLDEARIRQIAREEASAALGAQAKKKAAPPKPAADADATPAEPVPYTPTDSPPAAPPPSTPAATPPG